MLKKLFGWVKSLFVAEEEVVVPYKEVTEHTPRPTSYWAEYAEQLQILERAHQLAIQEEKERQRLTDTHIRNWKENNDMLNEFYKKGRVRKTRLSIVA